jgi:hypothetical protein
VYTNTAEGFISLPGTLNLLRRSLRLRDSG